jgi:hypothetical protein
MLAHCRLAKGTLPTIMKPTLLAILLLAGCGYPAGKQDGFTSSLQTSAPTHGQWILESYDATKGYTFVKDGIQYQAHCQLVRLDGGKARAADREGACVDVLPYLHQVVPGTMWEDELTVKSKPGGKDEWEVRFLIIAAK